MTNNSIGFIISMICFFLFITCGAADPTIEDMKRVRKNYLDLRFQKPFNSTLAEMNDEKLMKLSCAQNHVNCDLVMELLKKNDPEFYKKYQEAK